MKSHTQENVVNNRVHYIYSTCSGDRLCRVCVNNTPVGFPCAGLLMFAGDPLLHVPTAKYEHAHHPTFSLYESGPGGGAFLFSSLLRPAHRAYEVVVQQTREVVVGRAAIHGHHDCGGNAADCEKADPQLGSSVMHR